MSEQRAPKQVISLTSHVSYGHVGGQAAILPLQRLGCEVWHVPTVLFSNHPGHNGYGGGPVKLVRFDDLVDSVLVRGFADNCAAMHSGYMGQGGTEAAALRCRERIKQHRSDAVYLCDPVMGDHGRLYVADEVVTALREQLVPASDIVTPNRFELELLIGRQLGGLKDVAAACDELRQRGPSAVVCTTAEETTDNLTLLVNQADGTHVIDIPYLAGAPFGTGDAFAAVLLGRLLEGWNLVEAACLAAASVYGLIRRSLDNHSAELALVAGQDEIVAPAVKFAARRLE
jgi:pyridoxine kinase